MIKKTLQPKSIKCPTCGKELKPTERPQIDGKNTVICEACYVDMLYPLLREHHMETVDPGNPVRL